MKQFLINLIKKIKKKYIIIIYIYVPNGLYGSLNTDENPHSCTSYFLLLLFFYY